MNTNGVVSEVFTDIKEAELQAVVYRCQNRPECDQPDHVKPCEHCRAFNYGRVAYTSADTVQTLEWRIHDWIVRQTERVLRRLGGQSAVDEFRNQLAKDKEN